MKKKRLVILVDQKRRDLPMAALLAHHVEQAGVECLLEPVQAWKACVACDRPDMVMLSGLFAESSIAYSRRLHELGVKIALLPNEGVFYEEEYIQYATYRHHSQAWADLYLGWNDTMTDGVRQNLGKTNPAIRCETTGCPRFDFNFPPLRQRLPPPAERTLLVCTNFGFAHYYTEDRSRSEEMFAALKGKVKVLEDGWALVEDNWRSQQKMFVFMNRLLEQSGVRIIFKPHPNEYLGDYDRWMATLPPEHRQRIEFARDAYIWEVLPKCDLLLNCETCITSVEAWMVGLPVMELWFNKKPPFYSPEISQWNPGCSEPDQIIARIQEVLAGPADPALQAGRSDHLHRYYGDPQGTTARRIARIIAEEIQSASPDFRKLSFSERRRGLKLGLTKSLGVSYSYQPGTGLKAALLPRKYRDKQKVAMRAISPREAASWRARVSGMLAEGGPEGVRVRFGSVAQAWVTGKRGAMRQ